MSPKAPESSALTGFVSVELDSKWNLFLPGKQKARIEVKIENLETGNTYNAKTNLDGWFFLPNVPPGAYTLSQWGIERTSSSENWWLRGDVTGNAIDLQPGSVGVFKSTSGKVAVISAPNNKFSFSVDLDDIEPTQLDNYISLNHADWIR